MRAHPLGINRRLLIVVAIVVASLLAAWVWSYSNTDPKPPVRFGEPKTVRGTLEFDQERFVVVGSRDFPNGLTLTNSKAPEVESVLKPKIGRRVTVYGAIAQPGDTTIFALWINGRSLVNEDGNVPANPTPPFKSIFAAWSESQQTCIRTALTSEVLDELLASDTLHPTDEQIVLLNECLTTPSTAE